jgi:hypothetical protein
MRLTEGNVANVSTLPRSQAFAASGVVSNIQQYQHRQ